jgi:cysteinyl-tRNA synthetase
MALKLYNTLTKKKEQFIPLEKGKVKMYSCGPTVYDYASIGNMWSYLSADILRRYLEYLGYEVRHIKNITDVGHFTDDEELSISGEDKMEKAAKREKKTPLEIAEYYIEYFLRDEKKLNIKKPHFQPRPTQEIDQIISIIKNLIQKGYAYETTDGVYFSVEKFKNYGNLSGNTIAQLEAGASKRIEENEDKKHHADFVLWIKQVGKNKKHTLHWNSPWGKGFPGWHIECTAMASRYLGDSIDIHTGGEDNIFPHHECEIAQTEAYTQKPFVTYWFHTRHFLVDGKKMSKSLGNIYTISKVPDNRFKNLEEEGFHPLAFRTLKLGTHYRSSANFTLDALKQAEKNWQRINEFYNLILNKVTNKHKLALPNKNKSQNKSVISNTIKDKNQIEKIEKSSINTKKYQQRFEKALNDDLNTPQALTIVLELVKKGNTLINNNQSIDAANIQKFLENADKVFAILEKNPLSKNKSITIPKKIISLAQKREQFRQEKNFKKADQIRKIIEKKGFVLIDKPDSYEIKKIASSKS